MAFISEQISNLINGVSQQPPKLRLESQCEAQENAWVSISEGLKKRPPLEHVAKLTNKTDTDCNVHYIDRSDTERYVLVTFSDQFDSDFSDDFTGAETEAFKLSDGSSQSVEGLSGDALNYLTTADARDNLHFLTISDTSLILNKGTTVAQSGTLGDARDPEGIFFLKQATNAATMKLYVNGVNVGTVTSSTDAATQVTDIYNDLVANLGTTNWNITKFGSSNVWLSRKDGADFTMHADAPESNLVAIKDSTREFTDLPARTKDGFVVKVTGDPGTAVDDYWLKHFNQADEDTGEWLETVEPGLDNNLSASTMPIKLTRTSEAPWGSAFASDFGETVFSLALNTWDGREVGDAETVPNPSFIGKTLNDIFFHKNRLGLLADENIIMSEIGSYYNFYATTATDVLATDPIDLASPTDKVSILRHSIQYDENLLLFSDFAQFKLTEYAAGGLSPTNSKLTVITEYEHDKDVRPILNGRKIYFSDTNDGFSSIKEWGIVEDLAEETAEDITAHVPSYIQGSGYSIIPHDEFLFVLSDLQLNEIFCYKYLYQQGTKKLSSWGKWIFKDEEKVVGLSVIDHIAYFVIVRPDGTYLDKMTLQDANLNDLTPSSTQLSFKVLLDRLTTITGVYNSGDDTTSWTLPYPDDFGSTFRVILGPAFTNQEGGQVQGLSQTTPTTLKATGDYSAGYCYVGKEYQFRYEFTEPTIKTEVKGRQTALPGGTLKIRKFSVDYFKTGFFTLKITAPGRNSTSYNFTGRILGSVLNKIGTVPFETGSFKKLILADNRNLQIELVSNSYLPCTFTGADWEGNYVVRTVPKR